MIRSTIDTIFRYIHIIYWCIESIEMQHEFTMIYNCVLKHCQSIGICATRCNYNNLIQMDLNTIKDYTNTKLDSALICINIVADFFGMLVFIGRHCVWLQFIITGAWRLMLNTDSPIINIFHEVTDSLLQVLCL